MVSKRKGFTLVELLIVIVVIGILSAMMMLSSTEAVTSAKASNIVSDLRNMKTAALALFVDKLDNWEDTTNATGPKFKDDTNTNESTVLKYMNATNSSTSGTSGSYNDYGIATTKESGKSYSDAKWYVYCKVADRRVGEKLAGRAKSVGLWNGDKLTATTDGTCGTITEAPTDNYTAPAANDTNYVLMEVR